MYMLNNTTVPSVGSNSKHKGILSITGFIMAPQFPIKLAFSMVYPSQSRDLSTMLCRLSKFVTTQS